MSRLGALAELQAVDDRLEQLRTAIRELERSLRGDPELERRRERLQAAGAEHQQAEAAVAELEREAAELRRRATLLEKRMFDGSVRNPAELLTMQHEFDAVRAQLAGIEEQELERMETEEITATAEHDAQALVDELEQQRSASAGPDRERLAQLRAELQQVTAERDTVTPSLDPADLALYTRLAGRLRPVVVQLQGDTCGGCHLPMSHAEARAARTSERPVQCTNCDRILVA